MYAMHPDSHPFAPWFGGRPGVDDGERGRGRERGDHHDHDDHEHHRGHPGRGPRWLAMAGGPRRGPGGRGPGGHFGGPFGAFGGPFGGPPGGRGPRARRGDVRSAILRLLAEQPMHGYQIIQELTNRTGGVWNPSPGSVYPTLAALEDQGLVRADEVDGKRTFALTEAGRAQATAEAGRPAPWDEVAAGGSDHADMREAAVSVVQAARQVAATGTGGQKERAVGILREARRKLYQLLAEDPEAPAPPA